MPQEGKAGAGQGRQAGDGEEVSLVVSLAAQRQLIRQRRTVYLPEQQMIEALSNRTAAALRLLSERDWLPSDSEPE